MPQLWEDPTVGGVHLFDHLLPSSQRSIAVESRNSRIAVGCRVVDKGPFGDDQPDAPFGSTPVVGSDILPRHIAWRETPRHRRHDQTVVELELRGVEYSEQESLDPRPLRFSGPHLARVSSL